MDHFYAQIDGQRKVIGLSQLSGVVDAPDMISIPAYDDSLIGQTHDLASNAFTPPPAAPPDPRIWWVDTGPLKDRFDRYGYPGLKGLLLGLGRTNDVCYAAFADMGDRKYVDLLTRRDELLAVVAAMAAVVAAAGKPAFTVAMQHAVVETPTDEYERHIKGLA